MTLFRTKKIPLLLVLIALLIGGGLGWWFQKQLRPVVIEPRPAKRVVHAAKARIAPLPERSPEIQIEEGLNIEVFASSQPYQIIFRFPDDESYQSFLEELEGSRVELLEHLDPLRAMRLRYETSADLEQLLELANVTRFTSLPSVPMPPSDPLGRQRGLLAFGNQTLPWLGAAADRSRWGAGVRIAVIDSGVSPHAGLPSLAASLDLSARSGEGESDHQHGTTVASVIAGQDPRAPGVAPAVTLVSICVFNENQQADSFSVAAGLLSAIDQRVQIVNLSMGTQEDNPLIREAVKMVQSRGIVIVAASGNAAGSEPYYPAAYPDVISVGAVDARGVLLDFSNHGAALAITAPGCYVGTFTPDGRYVLASGTSMSAPLVTGAIAAVMSNDSGQRLTARQASELVLDYADEAGIPGPDSQFGFGILNIGRVMNRNVPGIVDVAITYQEATSAGVNVTVQNRGTVLLSNLLLEVATPEETRQLNISSLPARAIQTYFVPYTFRSELPTTITSTLHMGANPADIKPENNTLTTPYGILR